MWLQGWIAPRVSQLSLGFTQTRPDQRQLLGEHASCMG